MNTKLHFFVGETGDSKFVVFTNTEPFFCIQQNSEEDAIEAGLKAWKLYLRHNICGQTTTEFTPHITKKADFTSISRHLYPTKALTAAAC